MPTAVVMCDGAPSSIKAVELASFPGTFLNKHEGEQLIVAHMWDKKLATQLLPVMDPSAAASSSVAAAAPVPPITAMPQGTNTRASTSAPAGRTHRISTANAAALAAAFAQAEEALAVVSQPGNATVPQVMQAVVSAIHENKALRDTLNYKIETCVLPPPASANGEKKEEQGKGGKTASGRSTGAKASPRREASPSKAAHPNGVAAANSPDEAGDAAPVSVEALALKQHKDKATAIVHYAKSRADHHGTNIIVLGSGNGQEGKIVTVGLVAETALELLKASYLLYFIKAEGFMLRLTTAIVRSVVIVVLGSGSTSSSETNGVAVTSDSADGVAPGKLTEPKTSASEMDNVRALEAGRAAVRYALQKRRRESRDQTAVVLVVEPNMDTAQVELYEHAFAELLQAEQQPEEAEAAATAEVADATLNEAPTNVDTAAVAKTITETAEGIGAGAESAAGPVVIEDTWPVVSTCVLKASKQVMAPTIDNSVAQVVKFLQQHKAEYVVVADTAPSVLHKALMSMAKPHVVIVPHTQY